MPQTLSTTGNGSVNTLISKKNEATSNNQPGVNFYLWLKALVYITAVTLEKKRKSGKD